MSVADMVRAMNGDMVRGRVKVKKISNDPEAGPWLWDACHWGCEFAQVATWDEAMRWANRHWREHYESSVNAQWEKVRAEAREAVQRDRERRRRLREGK